MHVRILEFDAIVGILLVIYLGYLAIPGRVLRHVNRTRAALSWPLLNDLLPGERHKSDCCPIAESLNGEFTVGINQITCVFASESARSALHQGWSGHGYTSRRTGLVTALFVLFFDNGLYRKYQLSA